MHSALNGVVFLNPDQVIVAALVTTALGIVLILGFISLRRIIRNRYFRRRDERVRFIRQNWEKIIASELPASGWARKPMDRQIVEEIALDRMELADFEEMHKLQCLFRLSGILDMRIHEARKSRGWQLRKTLLILGRMQLPECVPAIIEVLDAPQEEVVLDAIRALGRIGTPQAGEAILLRLSRKPVQYLPQVLEVALSRCYRDESSSLLTLTLGAEEQWRPLMARALAAVATPDISGDLTALAADPLPEVRAAATRVLALARPSFAVTVLSELSNAPEWFVRLRAVVALGELVDPSTVPILIGRLCDANRLVRVRAACALAKLDGQQEKILRLTRETGDPYALQALFSEMERSGRIHQLVDALDQEVAEPRVESALITALEAGACRILIDLMLHHGSPLVRTKLTRILARSKSPKLLAQLEQIDPQRTTDEQREILQWLIATLRREHPAEQISEPVFRG